MEDWSEGWILGLDTSVPNGGICLYSPSRSALLHKDFPAEPRTSRVALPIIHKFLKDAGIDRQSIQAVGVAQGPGSFTGLRIGLATSKGIAMGLNCPLYGIPSMDALANSAMRRNAELSLPIANFLLIVRDAYHGEVFSTIFGPFIPDSPPTFPYIRAEDDLVGKPENIPVPPTGTVWVIGPKNELPFGRTEEFLNYRFKTMNVTSAPDGVAYLAWEAICRGIPPASPDMQPIYGRKPRAETQWNLPGT